MSRGAAVRKADLDRALRALKDAGETVARVEIMPGGGVAILTGAQVVEQGSGLDAWRARRNAARADQGS